MGGGGRILRRRACLYGLRADDRDPQGGCRGDAALRFRAVADRADHGLSRRSAVPTNDPANPFAHIGFTVPFSMSEQPAASINCGYAPDGLPIGLQIVGRRFDDLGVLRLRAFMRTCARRSAPVRFCGHKRRQSRGSCPCAAGARGPERRRRDFWRAASGKPGPVSQTRRQTSSPSVLSRNSIAGTTPASAASTALAASRMRNFRLRP